MQRRWEPSESFNLAELQSYPFPTIGDFADELVLKDHAGNVLTPVSCAGTGWRLYLSHFLPPRHGKDGITCIGCGSYLNRKDPIMGVMGVLMGATFTWGLAHGWGFCSNCGYPTVAYHYITFEGGIEERLVMILQSHPDSVQRREEVPA